MSRPDLLAEDVEGLLASHKTRQQAREVIERHQLQGGPRGGGAFSALGLMLLILAVLALINTPALARAVVAYGPNVIAFVVNFVRTAL